ncbi:MAG: NAD(P)/FAD-dependent oxidoreductase [Tannerella sp.]|jgi:all-trans-retinol 13,14-reductase|nr:NAD(P)/FAD-dependent oxidoreductase [Tannerella sp.]
MKYDVIIIGSGLGGLQCGYILSKHGLNVCVLEKQGRPGGCLQTFRRGKHTFDTGFHYVGGMDEGQPLHRLFSYFGLTRLPWRRMDENGFDEVIIDRKSYLFANGYERFAETLSEHFPRQRRNLKQYTAFLRNVSDHLFDSFEKKAEEDLYGNSLFAKSAYAYLASTIDDPLLRNVLSGASLKMELNPETLPLYIFAQINSSFIQSAWRLQGGGAQIADSLVKSIEKNGGTLRLNARVTRLIEENGRIAAAEVNGGERIEAASFIAATHPAAALSLITESALIRNIYRKRIAGLENTFGMFTANIALKESAVPYRNRNLYIYENGDLWQPPTACRPDQPAASCALVSFQPPAGNSPCTSAIDILTPMYWPEVEPWAHTTVGRRGSSYTSLKQQKAGACIRLAAAYIPELENPGAIENICTSTPLTYRDYTATPCGSAYGIRKNCRQLMTTLLSPRTPEPNLYLTGQNLNLHGLLGVSMTAFFTCAELLGMNTATRGLL